MPEEEEKKQTSILLGRPFLRTAKFRLDPFTGTFSFAIGVMRIYFSIEKMMKEPVVNCIESCDDEIDKLVAEVQDEEVLLQSEERSEMMDAPRPFPRPVRNSLIFKIESIVVEESKPEVRLTVGFVNKKGVTELQPIKNTEY
ncbi:hypothetical protein PIB30_076425 [Stylosanthes scabra]|uniref:Uncharacterized protein n=1 Tax=Stylosanthes scabra TaxID=79078 RepID=A0ABU6YS24_9FABA|nr:hypothetical protein [Stylosanthes scabra]